MHDDDTEPLYVLDHQGYPMLEHDLDTWCAWYQRPENRRIAFTDLGKGYEVSTVFLGLEIEPHRFFETAVWHGDRVLALTRYSDRSDAMCGHDCAVELARASAGAEP